MKKRIKKSTKSKKKVTAVKRKTKVKAVKRKKLKVKGKTKPKPRKKVTKKKLAVRNMKVNKRDDAIIQAKAKKYTKGNLSTWLRHASLKYVPKKNEKFDSYPLGNPK